MQKNIVKHPHQFAGLQGDFQAVKFLFQVLQLEEWILDQYTTLGQKYNGPQESDQRIEKDREHGKIKESKKAVQIFCFHEWSGTGICGMMQESGNTLGL